VYRADLQPERPAGPVHAQSKERARVSGMP
jgi:hypothetical protein